MRCTMNDDPRAEVAAWLAANWDDDRSVREWRNLLADAGWGCPHWPRDWYGRGLGPRQCAIVDEEFNRIGAVGVATGTAMALAAPTILEHGSDEMKARLLRPALTGEHRWC